MYVNHEIRDKHLYHRFLFIFITVINLRAKLLPWNQTVHQIFLAHSAYKSFVR